MASPPIPPRIAHYRIERTLGRGGMGTVVAARDEKLERPIALKLLHKDALSGNAARLWREARAAAAVRHPAVCQVFEVGEDGDHLYIAMELLEGETLASRLTRGPLAVHEVLALADALLTAIAAIHSQGLLHRDLKPANLMLTMHGLKVVDFGLARASLMPPEAAITGAITVDGAIVGTPGYLAPEVLNGAPPDVRSDLFAAGAVIFEMLAARPAFAGVTAVAIASAVLHDRPPALTGGPAVAAIDRVLRRALSKDPAQRFPSALDMADALRGVRRPDVIAPVTARAARRIIVLPFRALRRDEDTDFLCASLPEAVTATLSQLDSVVVRSSLLATKFGAAPDLERLASEGDVDVALAGTMFRAGDDIRLNTQLIDVPAGTVLHSSTYHAAARNIIDLHDSVVRNIVDGLAPQLSPGDHAKLVRNVPASQTAYALFLRGNELARDRRRVAEAVSRYRESLALDPQYAPGWAQLGRAYRLSAKYESNPGNHLEQSREALDHALAIDPELDLAHNVYAQLEADMGRSRDAMVRLLRRAAKRGAAAEIFAGLVYACRFCGLSAESITFHHEAKRLDATVPTSVTQSYFQSGDYLRCLETAGEDLGYIGPAALDAMGRRDAAIEELRARLDGGMPASGARLLIESLLATFQHESERAMDLVQQFLDAGYIGWEAHTYVARQLIHVGRMDEGLALLEKSVSAGFHPAQWLERDHWFDGARTMPRFLQILEQAQRESALSRAAFVAEGGEELMGR